MTLKTGVMAAVNSVFYHRNKLHFKIFSKQIFEIIFHNITVLQYFGQINI